MIDRELIETFDVYLSERSLSFEGVIIGGAALILMGVIDRVTQDIDCLDPRIPADIQAASRAFARTRALKESWLNNGPESLKNDLPAGWQEHVELVFQGRSLRLFTLGRLDLLRSKVFAFCDRQQDLQDCVAMRPTLDELRAIRPWLEDRDANPLWAEHVARSLRVLGQELGHDLQA